MKLSIVILSHNGTDLTRRCLRSLDEFMGRRTDTEVVVVDNGSEDDCRGLILQEFGLWGTRLKIIRLVTNQGVAGGRNAGIAHCGPSEYIMLLDNDTILPQGAIDNLIDYMDANTACGIAAPCLKGIDGLIQKNCKRYPGLLEKALNLLGRKAVSNVPLAEGVTHPCYVIGACQIFRKSLIDKIGPLDEKIFFGPEDADFCIRINNAGLTVDYIPSIEIIHDWQRTSRRSPLSSTSIRHIKGLLYFYRKWNRFL